MNITPEDVKFAKEMIKLEWNLWQGVLLPSGCTPRDEQILTAVSCEFAQKCVLDLISRLKPELSSNQCTLNEKEVAEPPKSSVPCLNVNDAFRLNHVQRLRPSVMILGAGWKAVESMHITFVEVQGMSLRNCIENLMRNKANWHEVGQIMLLPDAMWSWRGNFQGLTDLISILKQRCPNATLYICGIPLFDKTKVEAWQLHWIKLYNQYTFKLCSTSADQSVQLFYMGKFINEHKNEWQPGKPYYAKQEAACKILQSLVKVFEHLAEKRLGINITCQNQSQ